MNTFNKFALTVSALGLISSANAAEYFIDLGTSDPVFAYAPVFTGTFDGSTGAIAGHNAETNTPGSAGVNVALGGGITFSTTTVGGHEFTAGSDPSALVALTNDYIYVNGSTVEGGPATSATYMISGVNATDTVVVEFLGGVWNPASEASFNGSGFTTTTGTEFTQIGSSATGSSSYTGTLGNSLAIEHTFSAVRITVTETAAVPEPSSTALLGLGSLALILRRRR